jgi:membrane carboxypeptidase/penicillin-binding protein
MRWGLEQSRNLMTVRVANDTGMDKVVRTIKSVGIGDYQPYLSMALGAGDTTVIRMVNAYAALANHGRQREPSLIDYVQDRNGKVIWRADNRACTGCSMPQWDGQPMPRLRPAGRQALDARTAYQVVHMLEGVVVRGTGETLHDLGLPLFGKTGTTSGPTNVWFVGGSPDIVRGLHGLRPAAQPGRLCAGRRLAAPVFKQFVLATRDRWADVPFPRRRASAWSRSIASRASACSAARRRTRPRPRSSGRPSSPIPNPRVTSGAGHRQAPELLDAIRRGANAVSGRATRTTSRGTSRGSGRHLLNLLADERRWTNSRARHVVEA